MPKDNISGVSGDFNAQVGWSTGSVQLAVVTADGKSLADLLKECADRDGIAGLSATLDRAGCNRVIRSVRKARDAAYGADA